MAVQRELERNLVQLRTANEGLQQFVRIASHDMREPLNTVIQFTGLIEQDADSTLSAAGRQYFAQVRTGTQRMRTLLDDVLSFARLDHTDEIALSPVALDTVLAAVQEALGSRITERQARIDTAALPAVVGHESLLVLLFQNLLSNGIKFTPAERAPQLSVSVGDDGEFVVVTLADQGIGIAASDLALLFVPFKRLHTRRQYDGTGLGLKICQRIISPMGGTIALESEPGAGTRPLVRLRRAAAAG